MSQLLFKRIYVDGKNPKGKNIYVAQNCYEKIWSQMNKLIPNSAEKMLAMRALQESCMWMSRAIALDAAESNPPREPVPAKDFNEASTETPESKPVAQPTIKYKSKKELDASLYGSMSLQLNDKAAKEAQEAHEKNMALITPLVPNNGEKDAQIEPDEVKEAKPKRASTKTTKKEAK